MSEQEQNDNVAEEEVAPEATLKTTRKKAEKLNPHDRVMKQFNDKKDATASDGFRVCCTPKVTGTVYDNDRNIRIPAASNGDVKASSPIKYGSFLHAQIAAGLVKIVE